MCVKMWPVTGRATETSVSLAPVRHLPPPGDTRQRPPESEAYWPLTLTCPVSSPGDMSWPCWWWCYPGCWCCDGDKCLEPALDCWTGPALVCPVSPLPAAHHSPLSALSVSPRVSPELSSQLQCQFLWTLATLATSAPVSVEHQRRTN